MHTVNLGASYEVTRTVSVFANTAWGQISAQNGMLDSNYSKPAAEDRYKFDLGTRKRLDGFGEATVTGFFVRQDDAALTSSSKVTVNGEDYALFENADRKNYGVEFEVRTNRFDNGVQLFANATSMKTRRTRSGNWETDKEVPDFLVGGGASYECGKFELAVFGNQVSSYENDRFLPAGAMPAPLGDCIELNAQLTYRHDENTEFFVRAENLTDNEYSTVAGYPHDGALLYAGFVKRFR
jgi:outer membrane receptor protein involved in Fe transport